MSKVQSCQFCHGQQKTNLLNESIIPTQVWEVRYGREIWLKHNVLVDGSRQAQYGSTVLRNRCPRVTSRVINRAVLEENGESMGYCRTAMFSQCIGTRKTWQREQQNDIVMDSKLLVKNEDVVAVEMTELQFLTSGSCVFCVLCTSRFC